MKRAVSVVMLILALGGLTANVTSSASADDSATQAVQSAGKEAIQYGPDATCNFDGVLIHCEYGVSQIDWPNGVHQWYVVSALNHVVYESGASF